MKLRSIDLLGRGGGRVRDLSGFRKGAHRVPDSVCERTREFVSRIAQEDIETEANTLREQLKSTLGYKRKELTLLCDGAHALITTKDFDLAIDYAQDEDDRQGYVISYQISNIKRPEIMRDAGLQAVLFRHFDEVRITLEVSYRIEDLIDTVEEEEPADVALEYPEDCSQVTVFIDGRDWYLRFWPHSIAVHSRFPGSPLQMFNHVEECQQWVRETPALAELLEGKRAADADL